MQESERESSPYKNAVTRAVGVYESVDVDTIDFDVIPGDYFLLASDGLTGYLNNVDIVPIINDAEEIKQIPSSFIDLANQRGGKDNITCVTIQVLDSSEKGDYVNEVNLKIETLRQVPIFKYLTYKELVKILNIAKVVEVESETRVISEGEEAESLFIIVTGSVKVHKKNTQIVSLKEGNHFGEMALIDKAPRSADVSTLENTKLLEISRTDFFDIIRNEPPFATKLLWSFLQILSTRLSATNAELSDTGRLEKVEDLTHELFSIDEPPEN